MQIKSKKPLISVVIPHLNQPDGLEACLGSLETQTLERSAFEVIVVDNGSAQLPEAVIARYPATRLLQQSAPDPVWRAIAALSKRAAIFLRS